MGLYGIFHGQCTARRKTIASFSVLLLLTAAIIGLSASTTNANGMLVGRAWLPADPASPAAEGAAPALEVDQQGAIEVEPTITFGLAAPGQIP
jgi:hypothetical protein